MSNRLKLIRRRCRWKSCRSCQLSASLLLPRDGHQRRSAFSSCHRLSAHRGAPLPGPRHGHLPAPDLPPQVFFSSWWSVPAAEQGQPSLISANCQSGGALTLVLKSRSSLRSSFAGTTGMMEPLGGAGLAPLCFAISYDNQLAKDGIRWQYQPVGVLLNIWRLIDRNLRVRLVDLGPRVTKLAHTKTFL